jgi:hypothetical protein
MDRSGNQRISLQLSKGVRIKEVDANGLRRLKKLVQEGSFASSSRAEEKEAVIFQYISVSP